MLGLVGAASPELSIPGAESQRDSKDLWLGHVLRVNRWLRLAVANKGSTGWPVLWWMLAWALSQ